MLFFHVWFRGIAYSKAWTMRSSGVASRKERESWTVNNWSWKLSDQVQSHTAAVINFIFHHNRVCQVTAKGEQNRKALNESMPMATKSMAARLSSQQEVPDIYKLCNATHSNRALQQVQFSILPDYSIYRHVTSPKKNPKKYIQHFFLCSSYPLIFFPLPDIASISKYSQCFCSVNGFTLSSRQQKGSVLALILCLYWAGGGFKPSSIFGVYSELSDLRAIYWCSISCVYRGPFEPWPSKEQP